jgi:hypothetical protein
MALVSALYLYREFIFGYRMFGELFYLGGCYVFSCNVRHELGYCTAGLYGPHIVVR